MKLIKTKTVEKRLRLVTHRQETQSFTDHEQARFFEVDRTYPRDKWGKLVIGPDMWEFSNYHKYSVMGRAEEKMLGQVRVGFIQLDHARNLFYQHRLAFYGKCDCGHEGYYSAKDLQERKVVGLGCARLECSAPPPLFRVWYDPKIAVRLQVSQAQAACPTYRDEISRYSVPYEDEVERLTLLLEKRPVSTEGHWFYGCKQFHKAAMAVGKLPADALFPAGEILFDTAEGAFTEEELNQVFHIDTEEALKHKFVGWDRDFLDPLIALAEVNDESKQAECRRPRVRRLAKADKEDKRRQGTQGRPPS
jgi:hypothetical protein